MRLFLFVCEHRQRELCALCYSALVEVTSNVGSQFSPSTLAAPLSALKRPVILSLSLSSVGAGVTDNHLFLM